MHPALTTLRPPRGAPSAEDRSHASGGDLHQGGDGHPGQTAPSPAGAPQRLEGGFRFWACARGADGRSRTTAVWGLWLDQAIVFAADTESVAVGDPSVFPASVVQLDDEGEVKVVDGRAERVDDRGLLLRFASECEAKYGFEPDPGDPDTPVYAVRPSRLDLQLEGRT